MWQTDRYLARINTPRPEHCDAEALRLLTRAHLENVPFEDLEPFLDRRSPSLEEDRLFEKIVEQRRGGYCFELNKAFYLLVTALGYEADRMAARIVYHRDEPRPFSHRVSVVKADGKRWFCDVGFGGPGPKGALEFAPDITQEIFGDCYRFRFTGTDAVLQLLEDGRFTDVLIICTRPCTEADFVPLNGYFGYHPDSVFTQRRVLYRCLPDGIVSLVGSELRITRSRVSESRLLEESEIPAALEKWFGIVL